MLRTRLGVIYMNFRTIAIVIAVILFVAYALGVGGKLGIGFLGAGLAFFAASFISVSKTS